MTSDDCKETPKRNPSKSRRRRDLSERKFKEVVDEYFDEIIRVKLDGRWQKLTIYQAIVAQLMAQTFRGDKRARRVLMRYLKYGRQRDSSGRIIIKLKPDEGDKSE